MHYPTLGYFSKKLLIYATRSIKELESMRAQYYRLQRSAPFKLKENQVIIPCLSFQILKQQETTDAPFNRSAEVDANVSLNLAAEFDEKQSNAK